MSLREHLTRSPEQHLVKSTVQKTVSFLVSSFVAALCNRAGHIYFHAVVSSFFSSPNLSSRRLDVYHTSIHGVALV